MNRIAKRPRRLVHVAKARHIDRLVHVRKGRRIGRLIHVPATTARSNVRKPGKRRSSPKSTR